MQDYIYVVYRETKTTGCEMEDGADTRETKTEIIIIPGSMEEKYQEDLADEYGYQDYSYQFDSKKLCEVSIFELKEMLTTLKNLESEGAFKEILKEE